MSACATTDAARFAGIEADEDDFEGIDATVSCTACEAVCCRLTVVLMPGDDIAPHLTERNAHGVDVMARDEEGWCVAVDARHMHCSIYDARPAVCRKFAMGGPYCRDIRASHDDHRARGIPLTMY
jgi:Fe-S-cluster containining protein